MDEDYIDWSLSDPAWTYETPSLNFGDYGMGNYSFDTPSYDYLFNTPSYDYGYEALPQEAIPDYAIQPGIDVSNLSQVGPGLYVDSQGNTLTDMDLQYGTSGAPKQSIANQLSSGGYDGGSPASYGPDLNMTPVGAGTYIDAGGQMAAKDLNGDPYGYLQTYGTLPYFDGTHLTKSGDIVGSNTAGVPVVPQVNKPATGGSSGGGSAGGASQPKTAAPTNLQKGLASAGTVAAILQALMGKNKKPPMPAQIGAKPMTWKGFKGGGEVSQGNAPQGGLGLLRGKTGGQDDAVPIRAAHGEYIFDADTVSALGDGNTDAGAAKLDKMREAVRTHKRSAPPSKIPPKAKSPLAYFKGER